MRKLNLRDLNILGIIRGNKKPTSVTYLRRGTEYNIDELNTSLQNLKDHKKIQPAENTAELSYEVIEK